MFYCHSGSVFFVCLFYFFSSRPVWALLDWSTQKLPYNCDVEPIQLNWCNFLCRLVLSLAFIVVACPYLEKLNSCKRVHPPSFTISVSPTQCHVACSVKLGQLLHVDQAVVNIAAEWLLLIVRAWLQLDEIRGVGASRGVLVEEAWEWVGGLLLGNEVFDNSSWMREDKRSPQGLGGWAFSVIALIDH